MPVVANVVAAATLLSLTESTILLVLAFALLQAGVSPIVIVAGVLAAALVPTDVRPTERSAAPDLPRPLLFPSRTTHTRLFPTKHSFSYSYLVVGLPIGWQGAVGTKLAADVGGSWFTVDAADYLARGDGHLGLEGKLKRYLESQGVDYPYAYLMTAPKSLGYAFNPVSFWYLYSATKELAAMILEVNNTSDERRIYYLESSGDGVFTQTWPKDFHVSPFNSRKGSYSVRVRDPFAPGLTGASGPDVHITLRSSKGHAKMVARLCAAAAPVDPATLSQWQFYRFVLAWGWVGFLTFGRVLVEAVQLFFVRKLDVWARPEPLQSTIARRATRDEVALESFFRRYLQRRATHVAVDYRPWGSEAERLTLGRDGPRVGITVLTPWFYERCCRYAHDADIWAREQSHGTLAAEHAELLSLPPSADPPISDPIVYGYMTAVSLLRRPLENGLTAERPRFSAMDKFVLTLSVAEQRSYASRVLRLVLAERLTLGGVVPVMDMLLPAIKGAVAWYAASTLSALLINT